MLDGADAGLLDISQPQRCCRPTLDAPRDAGAALDAYQMHLAVTCWRAPMRRGDVFGSFYLRCARRSQSS